MKRLLFSMACFASVQISYAVDDNPCRLLTQIAIVPFKEGEKSEDKAFNELLRSGEIAIPCLLDKISDASKMKDPRQAPKYGGFAVGDMAIFMLCEITGRDLEESLPSSVRAKFPTAGIYAYFEYVRIARNRAALQNNWKNWVQDLKRAKQ